jgi:hypothetical protein
MPFFIVTAVKTSNLTYIKSVGYLRDAVCEERRDLTPFHDFTPEQ